MRRVLVSAGAVLGFVAVALVLSQVIARWPSPVGLPSDGRSGTVEGINRLGNVWRGDGEIEFALPHRVDNQRADVIFLMWVRPTTWVRVAGSPIYVPALLLPNNKDESQIRKYATYLNGGGGMRAVVKRKGSKLVAVRLEPMPAREARRKAKRVEGIGRIDFSRSVEMTGVINGWGDNGPFHPGEPVDPAPRAMIQFTSPAIVSGYPAWVTVEASVSTTTVATLDGKPVDMTSDDPLGAVTQNLVKVRLRASDPRPATISLAGTKKEYRGPYPYEVWAR